MTQVDHSQQAHHEDFRVNDAVYISTMKESEPMAKSMTHAMKGIMGDLVSTIMIIIIITALHVISRR